MITRAFSEEGEKSPSIPGTPAKDPINRKLSSSTTLLEKRWKKLRYSRKDDNDPICLRKKTNFTKPLLSCVDDSSLNNRSSDSSEESESSCGRLVMSIDSSDKGDSESVSTEEQQLLLSWPEPQRKTKSSGRLKQSLVSLQCEEIVL